jgi:putative ABC transport system substrate-binding protein
MRRRALLGAAGAVALSLPFGTFAQAQRRRPYRIGVPFGSARESVAHLVAAFEEGMRDYGYVGGTDVAIEYRFGVGAADMSRMGEFMRDLVRAEVDLLVTATNPSTAAAKAATRNIPIVMWVGTDVVGQGFVSSLAKPGGSITGLTWDVGGEVVGKRLQLLKEAVPAIRRVAGIYDAPHEEAPVFREEMQKVASPLGVSLAWLRVPDELERLFAAAVRERADAIFPTGGGWMFSRRREIVALAARHRLAASYYDAAFVDAGGLMSYAPNLPGLIRSTWKYIDRIMKGARPGDLPVERPAKLELVLNLKAAKALGLAVPQPILVRADRVVE